MADFLVRKHPRGRHQEPAFTMEVFTQLSDAQRFLATYINHRGGKVTKVGNSGTYYDTEHEKHMRLFITKRLE